jgi:hypothetical protein
MDRHAHHRAATGHPPGSSRRAGGPAPWPHRSRGPAPLSRRNGVALLGLALLVASPGPLAAQRPRALDIGAPIRVTGFDVPDGIVTGVLAGVTRDTVSIAVEGSTEPLRIPRAGVSHLYVRVGRRSGAGHAALVGIVFGTGVGAVLALAERNRMAVPSVFVVAGGAGGAMVGGLVGQFIFRVPRWQEAPLAWLDDLASEP